MLIRILNLICGQPDMLANSRRENIRAILALTEKVPGQDRQLTYEQDANTKRCTSV